MHKVMIGSATKRRLLEASESVGERTAQHEKVYEATIVKLQEYETKMNAIRSISTEMAYLPTTV